MVKSSRGLRKRGRRRYQATIAASRRYRAIKKRTMTATKARRAKRMKLQQLGNSLREKPECRMTEAGLSNGFVDLNTVNLHTNDITIFPDRTGNGILQDRERDCLHWVGFKYHIHLVCNTDKPILCNIAFVIPKQTNAMSGDNFFRNLGSGAVDTRWRDFTSTLTPAERFNLPINTDDNVILKRKRFILHPKQPTTSYTPHLLNVRRMTGFIRIDRKMIFEDDTKTQPVNGRVYYVRWFDELGLTSAATPLTAAIKEERQFVNLWREINN